MTSHINIGISRFDYANIGMSDISLKPWNQSLSTT